MTAAKKGGRAEKAVLSRQEIATKRKALANKKMKAGGAASPARRALVGVFVLAASLLALLAVATFDAHDRKGPGFHNAVGPMGHLIAEALRGALGVCAYFVPVGGIYTAVVLFVGNRERRRLPQIISLALLTCSVAVLSQLMFAKDKGWAHPPGGALGAGLGGLMEGMFSTVGTVILVTAISAAALIVGTQYTFFKLCSYVWAGLTVLGRRISESAHVFWEAQKVSYQARQERLAQEKEEEAAFLAELEAEEEELSEAERLAEEAEAAEAEAMAEEAVRLARQAEKEQAANAKKALKESREKPERKPVREEAPEDDDAQDEQPSLPPERAERRPPGADPAWAASFLAPQPQLPASTEGAEPPRRARKTPQIVTPPSAPSSPPVPAAALAAPVAEAPAKPLVADKAEKPVAASPGNALVPAPPSALARMPLIVEPKAPPKPTAVKRPQDQFEFVGDRKSFSLPPLDVLEADKKERTALDKDAFLVTAEKLRAKLADFGIVGEVVEIRPGPVVTMYEFLPGPGIKVSKIAALQDDLAMAMEAMRVRIVAPIPGKGVVGIEVPNRDRETVFLKEIAEQDTFQKSASKLTMCVGKDIEGMPYVFDLVKAPHLLIAGTTGSGKSVAVNAMIMSILLKATPEEVRFIMVDPKMLELSVYEGIPHLLLPVVTDPKKAALALRWAVEEMERRYQLLSEAGVRNIAGYNKLVETSASEVKAAAPAPAAKKKTKPKKLFVVDVEGSTVPAASASDGMGVAAPREDDSDELREAIVSEPAPDLEADGEVDAEFEEEGDAPEQVEAAGEAKKELKKLPYIVVIIDELADLMMVASREVETYVARLAQMARAAGIHLMVATQRPSTDVVTGIIKANFPTRISFMLRSKPDSMTILGTVGAEALLGMGDMLIMPPTSAHLQRVHGAYVSEQEIKKAVDHLKAQGKPVFDESILKPRDEDVEGGEQEDELSDELYDQALAAVSEMRSVSISMLQRKMRIGYNRAARMIERMERDGVVGPADGAKPREVLLRGLGDMPGAGAM
ncbi:DNA translocase FtsK 4TM domain-containing protein [Corallococcus sp. BB11-1]|uniref:FtsK/SpoIIIE family DNA translocase n=1 Tax=Corallococcus sp. BB11-1 TaxID=2996783 RepID=UPI00226F210E|nr:DNA translocase FtsK 4TM domain-containing protein [Corallococcus sp. BB11-1]MCY1031055.1 DNA translocase FtsK 4TM domain-containing protein [Corallococcus sp. BB11-1]